MINAGRIKLHDPRSRSYEYPQQLPAVGKSVRHRMGAPNVDQFYTSGCVGFSGTNMLNCQSAARSRYQFNAQRYAGSTERRRYLGNNDGLINYSNATKLDPFNWTYPPTDQGSSAIGLMKYWKQIGVITAYEWTFSFNGFLAALQQQPLLVGTNWYDSMTYPDRDGRIRIAGSPVGGHEYLATAILWDAKIVSFENSWGENWGLQGRFYMHFRDAETLIMDGGDVAVPKFL